MNLKSLLALSVWAVKWGLMDCRHVLGMNGKWEISDVRVESLIDPADSTKKFDGYVQTLLCYPGLQIGHKFSVGRIKKLTTDATKGLTDARLGNLVQLFIEQRKGPPDVIFATARSIEQLRASRTATTPTGAEAPTPEDFMGIPIVYTDGIVNTETLAL